MLHIDKYKIASTDISFDDRYITHPIFSHLPPNDISISDHVFVYNDGRKYKIVPKKTIMTYPIIYDKYYDDIIKNTIYDITISLCPYSLSSVMYFGKYKLTNNVIENNILLYDVEKPNEVIIQMTGDIYSLVDKKKINKFIRKNEIKIMTLRNAISKFPDCLYLHIDTKLEPIIEKTYYSNDKIIYPISNKINKYHPKTIVYGIQYISSSNLQHTYKYSVMISKNATKESVYDTDIDISKNGIDKYLTENIDQIRDKGGVLIPSLWYAWYNMHPDTKIIKL